MSEEQQTYIDKINPDIINADYLRSIGADRKNFAEAEFNRIAPSLEQSARTWNDSQFNVTIPRFIYNQFITVLEERGFLNIRASSVDVSGRWLEITFEW